MDPVANRGVFITMVPLVSNKYRYIFFYNPKSACSVARKLFLDLHRDELSEQQQSHLTELNNANQDEWHAINQLFPIERDKDYSTYTKFTLVRHPLTRFVSAYLNRVVMQQMDLQPITDTLINKYGDDIELNYSFKQFVDYFESVAISTIEDTHFQPQSVLSGALSKYDICTPFYQRETRFGRLLKRLQNKNESPILQLDYVCKIETLYEDFTNVYQRIFINHPNKLESVKEKLAKLPLHNVTFTSSDYDQYASDHSAAELRSQGEMPSYTSFLTPYAVQILVKKYQKDFLLFDYSTDLDASVLQFEKQKNQHVNSLVPEDFDWQHYLLKNADLGANGIDNKVSAISHWIHHGRFEQREYKKTSS